MILTDEELLREALRWPHSPINTAILIRFEALIDQIAVLKKHGLEFNCPWTLEQELSRFTADIRQQTIQEITP